MPGGFLPIIGMVVGSLISALMMPKAPKAPSPAPTPPAPQVAAAPAAPEEPAKEPTISPEDAQAAANAATTRRKRNNASAQENPLETTPSVGVKTLLGE